ncbi:hypothetical protein RRG08_017216 [Elysia crispata]|uniref:protein-tyrosine-phosphatase n=1 Tax=Elysia crispata TaxID=231223 RepID=A0AAE0ZUM1_9GAST|nr:hypothetical protein RRG08_017216 [Elysia crispata]KAK3775927.1 hypothetical protein RRG08_017216 [Elysia crispata]KAK3775928.1 hypothetical protein RRG08_017216 [Elysia crispata]KAK3775929.1 hypothetical protein RRG08_017216 [Elysia crispata]KAK3775930.1 hypothetical protein RRG08_017216 [Elysia crispata]
MPPSIQHLEVVQIFCLVKHYQNKHLQVSHFHPHCLHTAPKFGNAQLINGPPEKQLTENYASLELNMSRILDPSQGEIKDVGLLVCINREGNKPCGDLPDSLGKAKTYSESKQKDFQDPYLTTPLDWRTGLTDWRTGLTEEAKYSFNVGDDQTCSQGYCNGPLPDGVSVEITVIACTDAGCSKSIATTYQTKAPSDDDAPVAAIVGGIIAVIIIVVLIILGALFLWRRRRIPRAKSRDPAIAEPEPFIRKERPVNVRNFSNEIARYHKDSNMLFQDDFDDIKKLSGDLKSSSDEAKREENRVKNRYVNILPYDQSRVKLSIHPDEPETMDFINANYIPGFNSVREYIATQGPMYCTIPDFWRMMWEQNSRIIVMLSDLQEAGKRKVDLYWPENLNEPINYGNIVVEMTNFSQLRKYTIRNFIMSLGDNKPRKVTHFFLAGWMDFSANLKYSDVLEFAKLVRQEATPANSGPITVHCSAGVGRTGTFIALDYFMQHLDRHGLDGEIDIFSYVMRMRYNRPSMVQAETQYIFIYDALEEVIKEKLEKEKEKQYDNFRPNSDTYVNLNAQPQEENIYANTNGQTQPDNMHVYDNQAYAPDEMEDSKPLEETKTPTTVL